MESPANSFLAALEDLLRERAPERLYLCVRDLVEHGLDVTRFKPGEPKPQRQDITQYLAAWSRHAGLSDEECRGWMIDYCGAVLSVLSRRSLAAIRHSTKSNIKYIYKDAVEFLCGGAKNPFRARCAPECPVYAEMEAAREAQAREALNPKPIPRYTPPVPIVVPRVKDVYREQFKAAQQFIREERAKGTKKRRILELLHERGFKTRTGRPWTYAILNSECPRMWQPPAATPPEPPAPPAP